MLRFGPGGGPGAPDGSLKILGWDAAGIVRAVGSEVTLFEPGEEVFYAGSVDRPGSYAEFQCVDERIVGRKPKDIGFAESAAMPLTTITAWEMLFDRLKIDRVKDGALPNARYERTRTTIDRAWPFDGRRSYPNHSSE
jgi:NADPH:quinone reductase